MAEVSEYKKKLVQDMGNLIKQYNLIGVVNMQNLPAPQLQSMRSELREKIELFMTKKRLMRIALEKAKNEKKNIEGLEKYFEGMPALIFTNENPFKLSKLLQKSKTSAPAKPGQIAPNDIIVNKGPTPFAPGPIISELSSAGIKVGVESGKVAVKEDTIVAKKGDKIKPKIAEILIRLNIKPMQVGLGLVAAYENGVIYQKGILEIDEKEFSNEINLAALQAFNLAFNIAYTTKDNIALLMAKAFNDAKALGISQEILDRGIIEELLNRAEMEMLSLKNTANIETKVPEIKEKVQKKEEKVLEEEKEIIEEEKVLEREKPKEIPVEEEVREAVKEEEEKELEKERIGKETELEEIEGQKEKEKKEEVKPREEIDKKVSKFVEKTKKFMKGEEETAADIIWEVEKEQKEEEKIQQQKERKEGKAVPSAHELKKQKEAKAQKEVEELTKELLRKGTLRKK